MKVAAWNINHRSRAKTIPAAMLSVISSLDADVLVLNEYVDGPQCDSLKCELSRLGFGKPLVSKARHGHNQVLIASRWPCVQADLPAPNDSHAASNFLAIRCMDQDFTVIGIRAPAYKSLRETASYWDQLTAMLDGCRAQKVLMVGDMNANPDLPRYAGGKSLQRLRSQGWQVPTAAGEWSYISPKGTTARIDHAVASPSIRSISTAYLTDVATRTQERSAISDHAVLVCTVEP